MPRVSFMVLVLLCYPLVACGEPKTPDQVEKTEVTPPKKVEAVQTVEAEPTACVDDKGCASGQKCQNGHCVAPPNGGPGCSDFPAPKFMFEKSELTTESISTLDRLAGCLTAGGLKRSKVLLVGHCDARGEYEFNMGLGAERAEAAKKYLTGKNVDAGRLSTSSRGKLDATGTDDASAANDRRVDIELR